MADMLHIIHYFGGVENLKGKKVAMTWAYSCLLYTSLWGYKKGGISSRYPLLSS